MQGNLDSRAIELATTALSEIRSHAAFCTEDRARQATQHAENKMEMRVIREEISTIAGQINEEIKASVRSNTNRVISVMIMIIVGLLSVVGVLLTTGYHLQRAVQ